MVASNEKSSPSVPLLTVSVIVPLSILFKTLFKTAVISTFQGYWKWNFTVRLQSEGCYSIPLTKSTTEEAKHSTTKLSWLAKIVVTSGVVRAIHVTKASEYLSKSAKAVFCNCILFFSFLTLSSQSRQRRHATMCLCQWRSCRVAESSETRQAMARTSQWQTARGMDWQESLQNVAPRHHRTCNTARKLNQFLVFSVPPQIYFAALGKPILMAHLNGHLKALWQCYESREGAL